MNFLLSNQEIQWLSRHSCEQLSVWLTVSCGEMNVLHFRNADIRTVLLYTLASLVHEFLKTLSSTSHHFLFLTLLHSDLPPVFGAHDLTLSCLHHDLDRIESKSQHRSLLPSEVCNIENMKNSPSLKRLYSHISGIIAVGKSERWSRRVEFQASDQWGRNRLHGYQSPPGMLGSNHLRPSPRWNKLRLNKNKF